MRRDGLRSGSREAEEAREKREEQESPGEGRQQTRQGLDSRPGSLSQEVERMEVDLEEESGSEANSWKESSRQQPENVALGSRTEAPKRRKPSRSILRFEKPPVKLSQGTGSEPSASQPSGGLKKGPSQPAVGPSSDPQEKGKPLINRLYIRNDYIFVYSTGLFFAFSIQFYRKTSSCREKLKKK